MVVVRTGFRLRKGKVKALTNIEASPVLFANFTQILLTIVPTQVANSTPWPQPASQDSDGEYPVQHVVSVRSSINDWLLAN